MALLFCKNTGENGFNKLWKKRALQLVYAVAIFCIVGSCACGRSNICSHSSSTSYSSECKRILSALTPNSDYFQQSLNKNKIWKLVKVARSGINGERRLLGGLGSSPPRCISKCGRCMPCRPVHVTVPPGTPVTTEYYPEAWRCKCGNKLYMP